jgi:transglutaminase-like putative cysteine protease
VTAPAAEPTEPAEPAQRSEPGRGYRVVHTTEYTYSDDVSVSYGRAHLLPRSVPGQRVRSGEVRVDPDPDELRSHVDFFGNVATYYAVRRPHRRLRVTADCSVVVARTPPDPAALDALGWEAARDAQAGDPGTRGDLLASPLVRVTSGVTDYAAASFQPGRRLGVALVDLLARIHTDFEYVSGATTVRTTLSELLHKRQGVCQDFAHFAVGCLRSVGLPARYVSGYLETAPPPGQPKLVGADASHAWAAVHVPELGWVSLDPTNNQLVDDSYVTSAWGRDYTDVPPLKGVILTHATESTMTVSVDVTRVR